MPIEVVVTLVLLIAGALLTARIEVRTDVPPPAAEDSTSLSARLLAPRPRTAGELVGF